MFVYAPTFLVSSLYWTLLNIANNERQNCDYGLNFHI